MLMGAAQYVGPSSVAVVGSGGAPSVAYMSASLAMTNWSGVGRANGAES